MKMICKRCRQSKYLVLEKGMCLECCLEVLEEAKEQKKAEQK